MVLNSAQEILNVLKESVDPYILITTHHKPDADAMGSSLGLRLFLKKLGFRTDFISPTDYASFLKWMHGAEETAPEKHWKFF
jgi:phosphoesterase RecJ-like protein